MQILFVCSGNTCRSPMAELYFNECRQLAGKTTCAKSAGIATEDGLPISANAFKVMQELEIDASDFRSTQLTLKLIEESDMIFTMTGSHKKTLISCVPEFAAKIDTLLQGTDVSDPYGGNLQCYKQTFSMMKEQLEKLAAEIDRV